MKHARAGKVRRLDGVSVRFPAVVVLAAMVLWLPAASAPAQTRTPPAGGEAPKTPQQQMDEQVQARLAQAWTAALSGKHQEAVTLADAVAKLNDPRYKSAAIEAAHLQARAYHQSGTAQGRARAAQLWQQIERLAPGQQSVQNRLQVAKALALEAEAQAVGNKPADAAKLKLAIDALEPLVKARRWDAAGVEAALDLSRLYAQADRFDESKKTLEDVVSRLANERTRAVMELPAGMEKPFLAAARAALKDLKYDRNAGLAEFEAAEKLRKAGKFAEAARAYQMVSKDFPATDYAHRSGLHTGDCLVGLGRGEQAIEHWKQFIAPLPAGPWRAQAYLRVVDFSLEEALDLPEAGKYAELARVALPTALADEKAGPSWRPAEYDVAIRVGLVSLVTGKSDDAVSAFTRAKAITDKKTVAESLDALIAAAKSGKGVIPEDCGPLSGQSAIGNRQSAISLALSMGVIHLLAGRLDNADAFFDRVVGTARGMGGTGVPPVIRPPLLGATPAQTAFAIFGKGAVLHARRKEAEARDAFLASIKAYSAGSWHDESLYRVATIIQDTAASKVAKADPAPSIRNPKSDAASAPGTAIPNPKPPTPHEREAAARAEKERLAALVKAKAEALPYWQELIKRYTTTDPATGKTAPASPRVEPAMYNAGVLLYELAEAAPAAQSEKAWKDAAAMLSRFCESYPKSPLAGDAYVRQVDIALERIFDLKFAMTLSIKGGEWAEQGGLQCDDTALVLWNRRDVVRRDENINYELFLRAGLTSLLNQDYPKAVEYLTLAKPESYSPRIIPPDNLNGVGVAFLLDAAKERRSFTKEQGIAATTNGQQKTAILLADMYLWALRPEKARSLYERLLISESVIGPVSTDLEGYAILEIAATYNCEREGYDTALEWLTKLSDTKYRNTYWPAYAKFRTALYTVNKTGDLKKSLDLYQAIIEEYPTHPITELANAYYCINACVLRDKERALRAGKAFLDRYPHSEWRWRIAQGLEDLQKGD